jgi:hypothetical protein
MSRVLHRTGKESLLTRRGDRSPIGEGGLRERDVVWLHLGRDQCLTFLLVPRWLVYINCRMLDWEGATKWTSGNIHSTTGACSPEIARRDQDVRSEPHRWTLKRPQVITRRMIRFAHEAQRFTGHGPSPKFVAGISLGHQPFLEISYEDKKGRVPVAHQLRRRYAREQQRQVMIKVRSVSLKSFLASREIPCRAKTRLVRGAAAGFSPSQDL